jgi:tRNA threonylcarbamoyl adenosine modification protein (Sua5/YciO/YrdC/YwlC family)
MPEYLRAGPRAGEAGDAPAAAAAAAALRDGLLAVLPTDTVYGLAARAFDGKAVGRIFEVKRRPRSRKLPLLIAEPSDVDRLGRAITGYARKLARRHWPGPLTLVVSAAADVPSWLVDERGTLALRCPDHALVREVARLLGEPIAATSVNFFGEVEATTPEEISEEILSAVAVVVDEGQSGGVPSTVVDCTGPEPRLLRRGPVAVQGGV